jgi:hypothetical protein
VYCRFNPLRIGQYAALARERDANHAQPPVSFVYAPKAQTNRSSGHLRSSAVSPCPAHNRKAGFQVFAQSKQNRTAFVAATPAVFAFASNGPSDPSGGAQGRVGSGAPFNASFPASAAGGVRPVQSAAPNVDDARSSNIGRISADRQPAARSAEGQPQAGGAQDAPSSAHFRPVEVLKSNRRTARRKHVKEVILDVTCEQVSESSPGGDVSQVIVHVITLPLGPPCAESACRRAVPPLYAPVHLRRRMWISTGNRSRAGQGRASSHAGPGARVTSC